MLLARPGLAMLIPIDGYASLNIVLVSESTVVCSMTASGDPHWTLFALDARNGDLKWRAQTSNVLSRSSLVSSNTFLIITKDFLEKRSLATGKIIWSARLDVIPEQKTKPRMKLKDYAQQVLQKVGLSSGPTTVTFARLGGGMPNRYGYHEPVLTGLRILLNRNAYSGSGCVINRCFEDWLLFDAISGKLVGGGSGGILGRSGASTVVGNYTGLFNIADGRTKELTDLVSAGRTYWYHFTDRVSSGQLSLNDRCAFEIESSIGNELVQFDSRSGRMRTMPIPATRTNYQSAWVLLDQHILRYSECLRYEVGRAESAAGTPWFELYDWDGNCTRSSEMPLGRSHSSWGWIRFVTRTHNDIVFDLDGHSFTVAVPSLTVSGPALPGRHGTEPHRSFDEPPRLSPFGNIRYESLGTTNIYKMLTDVAPHDLTVFARGSLTGSPLWKHMERVVIKRKE
jgi:hypothetical protein